MASDPNRWLFTKDQIQNSPSRKCGIDYDKELSYRQQAATLIQEMGQKLQVTQLCINTAIVYMHRFYMFHSFTKFHRNAIASCALFLAAKVEEQPRKLEHVLRVAHMLMFRDQPHLDPRSEQYMEQAQELITNENILLQTLGFDVAIDHPHTHVLRCCQLVRAASKDMAQASYFMATNSLHLTTMCLQYKPTVVASVCIHLVCKWSNTEIPTSSEGKDWYWYVDKTVMLEQLEQLTAEFLEIFNKCPSRLKRRVMQQPSFSNAVSSTASNTADAAAHHDSSSQRIKTEISNVPKPAGDRVPRPHDQRRDSKPPHPSSTSVSASSSSAAAAAVPSSSSSAAAAAQTAVHRTSQSGYPHPSAVNPHRSSSSSHPDKPKQMHRTSSSSSNSTVPRDQPKFPSHSSTGPPPPVQQPPQQQQQLKPVQQPSQKPQYPSSKSHSAAPPLGGSSAGVSTKSKSLFSPTHGVEQQSQQPKHSTQDLRKPSSSIFPSLLDASSNSGLEQQQQSVQQQHIPSSATDLGFDANKFFQERDSTWDFMNFDMGPGFSPPNEAIESMLNENKNSSSEFQQQQQQQHQGLSDLLASVSSPPTVGAMISEPTKAPDAAVEVSCQSSIAGQSATVAATAVESQLQQPHEEVHSGSDKKKKKKEKKEKKEKKKKNKERDSDDSKEKKHKHKHKDKDKSKDNQAAAAEEAAADALRSSLKVKIPTSRLKPEQAPAVAAPPSNGDSSRPELKLRISRDKISSGGGGGGSGAGGAASSDRDSRKRDRTSNSNLPPPSLPPAPKHARMDPSSQQQAGHYSRERNGYVGSNDKISMGVHCNNTYPTTKAKPDWFLQ